MIFEADDDNSPAYAVRLTNAARREMDQERQRLTLLSSDPIAQDWSAGIMAALRGLATYPKRCVVAEENYLFQRVSPNDTLRLLLYRRKRGPIWRILFSVHEADENDAPTVRVHHIRYGAQAPMTEWPDDAE